jgi:benzoyl-CoA reductase/2-hydroxyglutaryl-CoA dehydratase subunit BcrC/BadD/HgdB
VSSAIATLTRVYLERALPVGGLPLVGVTSNTVPWELIRAAGFQPYLLSPNSAKTTLADRYMEDVFSERMKSIFNVLISPESACLKAVIIPRTSEQEHKLYLYLREVLRQGSKRAPEPILYNLLHARSAEAEAYGMARTIDLKVQLERLSGRRMEDSALLASIAEGNGARAAIRKLLELREGPSPRLRGGEALALIGAWYFMDRGQYSQLAQQALDEITSRPAMNGPRILIQGSAVIGAAVEAHGGIVVAEDDWWGSRAAGRDIDASIDPTQAIFEKYYFDTPSPRVFPAAIADAWFLSQAATVDGVIFYLPHDDDVLGWDYPRLRDCMDERAIPHLMLRGDSGAEIKSFLAGLPHA